MTPSRGTSAWRAEMWGKGCDSSVIGAFYWMIGAPKIQCHRNAIRYFRAIGRVMVRHCYIVRGDVTGGYNCRKITGGTSVSAHAQGIAIDVNWDTNPYRTDKLVTDMPRAMIEEIEAIKTDAGVLAGRWGGDWDGRPETPQSNYDSMHFEVMCSPAEMRAGFSIPEIDFRNNKTWPLLDINEKGPAVHQLQQLLGMPSQQVDGYFGPVTAQHVRSYQSSRGLGADGIVGLGTWTALITQQPALVAGATPPSKGQTA